MWMPLVFVVEPAMKVLDLEDIPAYQRRLEFVYPLDDARISSAM
jgi:hypothetical protein